MASILLAFGIDAWWDGRSTDRERTRYLEALVADFTTNAERLGVLEATHGQIAEVAETLLGMSGPDARIGDPSEFEVLLAEVLHHPTYAPVTGTVDALAMGGSLRLLENDSLEAELASWDQELRDYAEDEGWGAEDVRVRLVPYLGAHAPLSMGYASNDRFAADYGALLRDLEFANHMTVRAHRTRVILDQIRELRAKIDRIAGLAGRELEG